MQISYSNKWIEGLLMAPAYFAYGVAIGTMPVLQWLISLFVGLLTLAWLYEIFLKRAVRAGKNTHIRAALFVGAELGLIGTLFAWLSH